MDERSEQEGEESPIRMGFAPSKEDQEAVLAEHVRMATLQEQSVNAECTRALATAAKELALGSAAFGAGSIAGKALAQAAERIANALEPEEIEEPGEVR